MFKGKVYFFESLDEENWSKVAKRGLFGVEQAIEWRQRTNNFKKVLQSIVIFKDDSELKKIEEFL